MNSVLILSASRTPIGSFMGSLKDIPSPRLGAIAIRQAVKEAGVAGSEIDECLMGCVLPAGVGQAPARQAAIFAELPSSVRCMTINRVCGSGLRAAMLAEQMIRCGDISVAVAGGMENMSRAPYLLEKAREGYRMGNGTLIDSMITDGLWDVYHQNHMGDFAELCAKKYTFTREDQDHFAKMSYTRALQSIASGKFKNEIAKVEIKDKKETRIFENDEEPGKGKIEKFPDLKPAFQKDGTVTAANASSINDGGAAIVLASEQYVSKKGLKPMARIIAHENFAGAPEWFTTAPVGAIQKLLKKANRSISDIDLFEINEAFSVVALACMKELNISEEKMNIRGGAVAMGHPIGASGARILTTLVHALKMENKKYGIAAICIGGGEASAMLVENL